MLHPSLGLAIGRFRSSQCKLRRGLAWGARGGPRGYAVTRPYRAPDRAAVAVYRRPRGLTTRHIGGTEDNIDAGHDAGAALPEDPDDVVQAAALLQTWREHPELNPTVAFASLVVNDASQISGILNMPDMKPYLPHRLELLNHMQQRLKVVWEKDDQKLILLHPDAVFDALSPTVRAASVPGPVVPISFRYDQFTAAFVLSRLLPQHALPPPTAFETIGHVVHLNLRRRHQPYRHLIGQVLLESLAQIRTVLVKVGEVSGPYRTYDFEIVAGANETRVALAEAGLRLRFDVAQAYWCSRLSEERQRLLREFPEGSLIADPFCGIGALCLLAARDKQCTILANDWNPHAIECLQQNVLDNGIDPKSIEARCGDAYDFLMDLGLSEKHPLPHHVVMNFPLEAAHFLGALRWWPINSAVVPRVHVYTFAKESETASAEDVAVEIVATNLVAGSDETAPSERRGQLDELYGCDVRVHTVRDVAPGKTVFCVSFGATSSLIRAMQGDF